MRLFGIETEYGITRDDVSEVDPVVESMELVRAHLAASFERRWDYAGEDPHEDARGFRVSGLQQDKEEDEFAKAAVERNGEHRAGCAGHWAQMQQVVGRERRGVLRDRGE